MIRFLLLFVSEKETFALLLGCRRRLRYVVTPRRRILHVGRPDAHDAFGGLRFPLRTLQAPQVIPTFGRIGIGQRLTRALEASAMQMPQEQVAVVRIVESIHVRVGHDRKSVCPYYYKPQKKKERKRNVVIHRRPT